MSAPVARCAGFELDPRKFLQDTAHMTSEQVGVYARLLFRGWRDLDHPGWYPDDDRALRQMAGCTDEEWGRSRDAIRACMEPDGEGFLIQKGQAKEWHRQTHSIKSTRAKMSELGKKSAISKALRKQAVDNGRSTHVEPTLNGEATSVLPPSFLPEESKTNTRRIRAVAPDGAARQDFDQVKADFLRVWAAFPHYGRRSSKAVSFARYKALRPRPDVESVLTAIDESRDSDDWTKDGGRFVPALEVWIAKRGWDSSDGRADPADEGAGSRANEMLRRARLHRETMGDPDAAL